MKFKMLDNGDFQFEPEQQATSWNGMAPNVIETVSDAAAMAIVTHFAKHNPVILRDALKESL